MQLIYLSYQLDILSLLVLFLSISKWSSIKCILPLLFICLLKQIQLGVKLGQLFLELFLVRFKLMTLLVKFVPVGVELIEDVEDCLGKGDIDVVIGQREIAGD